MDVEYELEQSMEIEALEAILMDDFKGIFSRHLFSLSCFLFWLFACFDL